MNKDDSKKSVGITQPADNISIGALQNVPSLLARTNSTSDLSEAELISLLKELKLSLQALALSQRLLGDLHRRSGKALKAVREERVKINPKSRKIVLTVDEYEKLKKLSTQSDPTE